MNDLGMLRPPITQQIYHPWLRSVFCIQMFSECKTSVHILSVININLGLNETET